MTQIRTRKTLLKTATALFVLAATAGCVRVSFEQTSALSSDGPVRNGLGYALVENSVPSDAFVKFDGQISRAVSMDERIYAQGIEQRIVFAAGSGVVGENFAEVRITKPTVFSDMTDELDLHAVDARNLRADYRRAFPNRAFTDSPSVHYNDYGGFGVHHFENGSLGCMYGWQNVEASATNTRNTRQLLNWWRDRTTTGHGAKLSYRIRFCAPNLSWMDSMEIMKRARLDVPADVFLRERRLRWGTGVASDGYSDSDPQDLNYVTTPPYSEQRGTLCAPGTTLENYRDYASPCPEEPKPTVRRAPRPTPAPAPQKVVSTQPKATPTPAEPAPAPQAIPGDSPLVPLPLPSTNPQPVSPDTPIVRNLPSGNGVVPTIRANQPVVLPGTDVQAPAAGNVPIVAVPNTPGVVPLPGGVPSIRAGQVPQIGNNGVVPIIQPNAQNGGGAFPMPAQSAASPRVIPLSPQPLVQVGQAPSDLPECVEGNNHLPHCRGKEQDE